MKYIYGMRLRGFSIGTYPVQGFVERRDDTSGKYHDLIVMNRQLSTQAEWAFDLDYIGKEED